MIAAVPDLPAHIAEGDFRPLLAWLRANVHEQGARYETQELIARATGRPTGRPAMAIGCRCRPRSRRDAGYTYGQVMLEWLHRLLAGVFSGRWSW